MEKIFYDRRVYESVDDGSLFQISQKSTVKIILAENVQRHFQAPFPPPPPFQEVGGGGHFVYIYIYTYTPHNKT